MLHSYLKINTYSITLQLINFPKLNTLVLNIRRLPGPQKCPWFSSYFPLPRLRVNHILTSSILPDFLFYKRNHFILLILCMQMF